MTRFPGSESGPCFAALRFPWPLPFPPRPPRPVARVCSAASLVLWAGLTSLDRASADYGRSLAAAAWRKRAKRSRDLPVSVWMVSRRAWGLGPRRAGVHLAMTVPRRVAFRFSLQRRRPGHSTFRGSIPSPPFPLSTLRRRPRERRRMNSGPLWAATPSTYDFFIRIHPPASRRAESVGPQFPFLRQPSAQPILRSFCGRNFSLFSRVVAAGLFTSGRRKWPKSVLSGPISLDLLTLGDLVGSLKLLSLGDFP